MRLSGLVALGLLALAAPSLLGEDQPAPVAAPGIAYEDVYRGYLGMGEAVIAGIPAYESAYGLGDDDCLAIAIIAHAASLPFQRAVEDFCGPCHRSLAELMRLYSVPPETLYVDVPRSSSYPVIYERLYEPYWDGRPVYVVSNADCCALFAFRVSCEFWRCPPPVFFQRVDACGSPLVAFHQQRAWWPPAEHPPGFAPLPPRELARPARVLAEAPARGAPGAAAPHGSSAGVVPLGTSRPASSGEQPRRPMPGSTPEQRPPRPVPPRQTPPTPNESPMRRESPPARQAPPASTAPEHVPRPSALPLTPAPAPAMPRPSASASAPAVSHPAPMPAASAPAISHPSPPAAPTGRGERRSERDPSTGDTRTPPSPH